MFPNFDPTLLNTPEFKEDSVREVIIAPMLNRLGYHPSGEYRVIRSKVLKHPFIQIGTRKHPVNIIPDYTLLHNEEVLLILDAKSPTEDVLDPAHIQQAYSYSIHPDINADHFALCNGKHLAVFNTRISKALLVVGFHEFESRWDEIEKHLGPKYLRQPELREFAPDFGFGLLQMGLSRDAAIVLMGVRLGLFGRVNDRLFTASANTDFAGRKHCVSFDFPPELLDQILAGLPGPLCARFNEALSRAPFQAAADLCVEIDVAVHLGGETQGQSEVFVPLVIEQVLAARFNPEPVAGDPNDIPPHVFRLRSAFKITTLTSAGDA